MNYMPIPESDPNNVRLKVAFILIWLFAACVFAFSQPTRYRVRAIQKMYYVPDTVYWGQDLQVYSPYLDTILFRLDSFEGSPLVVFTRTYQAVSTKTMQPGMYKWQLIYRNRAGVYQTDNGRLIIK